MSGRWRKRLADVVKTPSTGYNNNNDRKRMKLKVGVPNALRKMVAKKGGELRSIAEVSKKRRFESGKQRRKRIVIYVY